jgi:hypothetical protein
MPPPATIETSRMPMITSASELGWRSVVATSPPSSRAAQTGSACAPDLRDRTANLGELTRRPRLTTCGEIVGMAGRDPRRDKRLDHARREGTSGHGFRRHWPARKAVVHRAYRARWSSLLRQAAADTDPDEPLRAPRRGGEPTGVPAPGSVRASRSAVRRLIDRVDAHLAVPYDPAVHREPLAAALAALLRVAGPGEAVSREAVASVNVLLGEPLRQVGREHVRSIDDAWFVRDAARNAAMRGARHPDPYRWPHPLWADRSRWFTDFLHDQPHWKRRLTAWLRDTHRRLLKDR